MPGGLTRSAPEAGNNHVSNRSGGIGKDTWVISDEKVKPIRFKPSKSISTHSYKRLEGLPSRMGEQLFWMGRYLMRVKLNARILRIILKRQSEIENFDDPVDRETLPILLQGLTHSTMTYPGFVGEEGEANVASPEIELKSILHEDERTGTLAYSVKMLKNAGIAVRNRWSTDTWRMFDQLSQHWENWQKEASDHHRSARSALDELVINCAALQGFIVGSLSIEEGRPLLDIGLQLEKAILQTSLLRTFLCSKRSAEVEQEVMDALLLTLESLSSYRHRYRGEIRLDGIIDLLLLDDTYPQSLNFSIRKLKEDLDKLPSILERKKLRPDQKSILKVYSDLQLADLNELMETKGEGNYRENLEVLLGEIYGKLAEASSNIQATFFSHSYYKPQKSVFLFDSDV